MGRRARRGGVGLGPGLADRAGALRGGGLGSERPSHTSLNWDSIKDVDQARVMMMSQYRPARPAVRFNVKDGSEIRARAGVSLGAIDLTLVHDAVRQHGVTDHL